jgi:spore germination protein
MIIHVVQPDDTLYSIAETYKVTVSKIIQDNGLDDMDNLVIGQTIVIVYPEETYTVKDGDTLVSIADTHGVTLIELLRNNPYLSDRDYIYPGEVLTIRYGNRKGKIVTNGYAYPFIDMDILKRTLPFLTYLTIFNYTAGSTGEVLENDSGDQELIVAAKAYGVAPIMLVTTMSQRGEPNLEAAFNILTNVEYQNRHIEQILSVLKNKGYYGVNISLQYINPDNLHLYEAFLQNIITNINREGFPVSITISPQIYYENNEAIFVPVDYTVIGQLANAIILLSYNWGQSFGPPFPYPADKVNEYLSYTSSLVAPDKILIGLPLIGYDWELPYIPDQSRGYALSTEAAIRLAGEVGVPIQYDEAYKAPFFMYRNLQTQNEHIVWFKDARSVEWLTNLVPEFGLQGVGIWNIMQFFNQLWLIVNSEYEIETVPLTD